ncbi:MAG: potassium/proton antiporter, partial [Propionibacterium acidifaciens]
MAAADLTLLVAAAVAVVAIAAARLGTRAGLPALLLFLLVGVALGNAGFGIRFDDASLAHD